MRLTKSILNITILAILLSFSVISCKDDKEEVVVDNCPEGRTASLTIVTKMVHHTRPINGCRVFIKFGATNFPGEDTTKYDYAVTSDWNSPYATIDSLNCGSYYLYAVGIDSLLDPSNWIVKGGLPYSTTATAGTDSINVFITEGD